MTTLILLFLIAQGLQLSAQCEIPNPNAALACDMIASDQFACDIGDLVGCFTMSEDTSPGNQPAQLCPGQTTTAVNNITWIGFRAPAGNYNIVISPTNCTGSTNGNEGMQVGVYTNCNFTDAVFCNGACNLSPVLIPTGGLIAGATYYLFIDGCNLSVCEYTLEINGQYTYDNLVACADPEILLATTPVDCNEGDIFQSVSGIIDSTCTQNNTACNISGNTTWYQIQIDSEDATELITKVQSDEDVVWAIYSNKNGCLGDPILELYGSDGNNGLCSSSDGDNENTFVTPVNVVPGEDLPTYWIAITSLSDTDTIAFTLYYGSSLGCPVCNGAETTSDCQGGNFEAFVGGELSDGPFCRGEEVTVCVDITYNSVTTGNDWLHGVIPTFGRGWDISDLELANFDIGPNFEWFSADGACAPRLNGYDLPNMCTYMEDGRLKFCNTVCNPDCPCEGPLVDGSPIPSGWFVNTPGGSATCGVDCSPASFYGLSGGTLVEMDLCIPLKVKEFVNGNCEASTDLSISIQMTADAITGCWEDQSPCLIDPSINSPNWKVNCEATSTILAEDATVCSGEPVDVSIQTTVGTGDLLEISVIDNPNVEGEGQGASWSGGTLLIQNGSGSLQDLLVNTSPIEQTVLYSITAPDGDLCGSTTITVTVLPTPPLELVTTFSICEGEEASVTIDNAADFVSFLWTDASGAVLGTGPIVTFVAQENLTISVEASNADGCSNTGTTNVVVGGDAMQEDVELSLCPGEVVEFNDVVYGEEGTYQDSLVLASGCVVTYYNISIITGTVIATNVDTTICSGEAFMDLTEPGTYTIAIPSQTGCDTLLTVVLEVADEPIVITGESQYCEGDTVVIGDLIIVDGPGTYQDSIYNAQGCLTQINNISYVFSVSPTVTYDTIICEGESIFNLTTTGQYAVMLTTTEGCDSIVELGLTVLPASDPNCTVAVDDPLARQIKVYPNPAHDFMYIESNHVLDHYLITDVTGRKIFAPSKKINGGLELDISRLRAGVYMLQVSIGARCITKKMLVR